MTELNPHGEQMADESMVRNLHAQARAIWPQEATFFARYGIAGDSRILDAGCGTGEISSRLASLFADAHVTGVDIIDAHLELARSRYATLAPRLAFEHRSIFELGFQDDAFDLTVCRHVLHSIPHPDRAIAELTRVTRPGGYLHLLPEDYGMLHFQNRYIPNPIDFWTRVPAEFGLATETDNYIGRNAFTLLRQLGLRDVTVDYVVVDTVRTDRETFASILEAWRDGYSEVIGERTSVSSAEARRYFDATIENIRDPIGYAVWMLPIVAARVPS
jgi:ubiquinone/menaquinone biosynthesis C-methylase UbiE